ncbi:MAG: serine hydrolase [Clostridiales bacterium]|nr:serine hydrolase [Clostridiales bacterium]
MNKQERKEQISRFLKNELETGAIPGVALALATDKEILFRESFGYAQLEPFENKMTRETIFDLASLTKVIATTTAIMQLIETGRINLWDYLGKYYYNLSNDKKEITVFHLLTHTSGLQAIVRLWEQGYTYEEKIKYILDKPLQVGVGEKVIYSDLNFILLGDLICRVTGQRLDEYVVQHIFEPIGMAMTTFNPLRNLLFTSAKDYAATELCAWRGRVVAGEVHDENAYAFGGVSGHAGLFSTIDDLCIFLQMLLNDGVYNDVKVLSHRAVKLMRRDWTSNLGAHRGLGWDLAKNSHSSGGVLFTSSAFGHTGFTGTSLWVDPELKLGVALLTNRVHPTRENARIISLRPRLHNLITALYCDD